MPLPLAQNRKGRRWGSCLSPHQSVDDYIMYVNAFHAPFDRGIAKNQLACQVGPGRRLIRSGALLLDQIVIILPFGLRA